MKNQDTRIALDLGGTKLLIGEVDRQGKILQSKRYPTGFLTQREEMEVLFRSLEDYIETVGFMAGTPAGIGLGLIGQVNPATGNWLMIDMGRRETVPAQAMMEEHFGIPCRIENDVKSAALAEKVFGEGRETSDFIYLNVGTGLAAGFISGGRLIRGWGNDSGEIGHMVLDIHSQEVCVCGKKGCAEPIVSGSGMLARYERLLPDYPKSPLQKASGDGSTTLADIFWLSDAGDALAQKIALEAAEGIAVVITNLVRVTNPQRIVIGGGVMADGWMLNQVKKRMPRQEMDSLTGGIVLSGLDPREVGLLGAAVVGFGNGEE